MVLKDASGLVKLYAAVNVEQYNIVTTASSQTECLNRYKQLLGIESGSADNNNNQPDNSTSTDNGAPNNVTGSSDVSEPTVADAETNLTITDIKYIDINGNTYIYLISENDTLYRAKAASHEDMLLLKKVITFTLHTPAKILSHAKNRTDPLIKTSDCFKMT